MNTEKRFGSIRLLTLPEEPDVYLDMAITMADTIARNNAQGRRTVMIVPVGPTGQYPILARLVNSMRLSLRDVFFFNMDEYLLSPDTAVSHAHPMSFYARMEAEFYSRVDPALNIPSEQRFFPEPGREAAFDARIASLGGVDLCLGGLGINGHIAFNEPPEPDEPDDVEAFAALPSRVLRVSRETRTVNAIGYRRGDIQGMPEFCVTVGMKPILEAREIYIALNRAWQHGIAARVLTGPVTARVPASLLQRHSSVRFVTTEAIAEGL